MSDKVTVAKLDLNVDDLLKKASETKKKIDELAQAQKELATDTEEGRLQFVKNQAQLSKLRGEYGQQSKAVGALIQANGELISVEKALETALNAEVSTINEATKQNQNLKKIRNDVNVTTVEGRKAYDLINEKIKQNDEFIKSNVSELEQQKIGIGGYGDAIKEALGGTSLFSKALGENTSIQKVGAIGFQIVKKEIDGFKASLGQSTAQTVTNTASTIQNTGATEARTAVGFQLNKQTEAQATATNTATVAQRAQTIATNAGSNAFKLFRLALIATGVGAFVVVLSSLVAFLTSTQKGIDAVTSVLRPLQAIGQSLLGVFQRVGEALFETFSNPKQALLDLVDLIQTNLLNRLKAFSVILEGIKNLDFKQVSNGFLQATTGVENVIDKVSEAGKNTAKFFADAAATGAELDRLEKQLRKTRIANTASLSEQQELLKEQNKIAEDQTKPLAEREAAAQKSIQAAKEINRLKAEELALEIAILENQQSRNDTSDDEKLVLAQKIAEIKANNAQTLELETTQQNKLNGIRKQAQTEANAQRKAALDASIKEQNALLALFQAQQGIRAKELQEQLKIDEEISRKRLAILQTEFKAGNKSKTEFEAEKLAIENEFAQKQVEFQIQLAERVLQNEIKKLDAQKREQLFFSEELANVERQRLETRAQLQRDFEAQRLEAGVITETQFNEAIDAINADFQNRRDALQLEREKADAEKAKLDLENRRAIEDLIFQDDLLILQDRLEQQRLIEVANAEQTGADIALINQKYQLKRTELERKNAEMRKLAQLEELRATLGFFGNLSGALASLFGDNKEFATATAIVNGGLAVTEILATKSLLPEPLASVNRAVQIAAAIGTTAQSIRQINSAKFEKGGLMSIGGKRHSAGGTKFVGEDGTRFEAERGELIGVLNRGAAETFMNFNNMFGRGQVGTSFAENGGLISRAIETSGQVDFEKLAESLRQSPPIVYVEDVIEKANTRNQIVNYADF